MINLDVAVRMLARIVISERTGTAKQAWNQAWYATAYPRRGDGPMLDQGFDLDALVKHPEACGTAFCAAGHVVNDAGIPILWEWVEAGDDSRFEAWTTKDGRPISMVAAELLNLPGWEDADNAVSALSRWPLFSGGNDVDDLFDYVLNHSDRNQVPGRADLEALVEADIERLTQGRGDASSATP